MHTILCIVDMLNETQPNACGYIRLFLPLTKRLVGKHLNVRFVTLDDIRCFKADVVIAQRLAVNTLDKVNRLVGYCADVGARLIVDLDDDLMSLPEYHPDHAMFRALRPVVLKLVAEADELWVSTAPLAERFLGIAKHIEVFANELDSRVWTTRPVAAAEPGRPVRMLYMGTSTHRPDFERLILPAFTRLKAEFGSRIELDLIGVTDAPGERFKILNRPADIDNSYPAFATWLQSLPPYDIGLAPLLDDVFNRCKSDLKWQEYSALGLATVAADLPAYDATIQHERNGLLARADEEGFYAGMRRLVVDAVLRRSLQEQAQHHAAQRLALSAQAEPRLERLRALLGQPRRPDAPAPRVAAPDVLVGRIDRQVLSQAFVRGRGVEVGALQIPLPVGADAQVQYVDRMSKPELYEHYPELRPHRLVDVDIIDNGETLATIASDSQDFIIANHFIEHCQDPIQTLTNFVRVLRPGGIIFMAVPDMRHTFDRNRERTGLAHLVKDHAEGPAGSRAQHFREWTTLVEPHFGRVYPDEAAISARVHDLMTQDYSIHFHTFLPDDMRALITHCAEADGVPLATVFGGEFGEEMVFILRKTRGASAQPMGAREPALAAAGGG